MFHKEGHKIIFFAFIITSFCCLIADRFISTQWIKVLIMMVLFTFLSIILQFFRNPKRHTVINNNHVISPVDGKVVVIEEVMEKEYFKDKRLQVSVFMSPINVHVTRFPVGGRVVFSKYHPGKYLVAWHPKASEENERTSVVVENKHFGKILHRQIAGALAKRIVNYASLNNEVIQGSESGFIKFGSRVDLFLPLGTKINVQLNQKVKGGESIIAAINE